jgi:hypothetical protein
VLKFISDQEKEGVEKGEMFIFYNRSSRIIFLSFKRYGLIRNLTND